MSTTIFESYHALEKWLDEILFFLGESKAAPFRQTAPPEPLLDEEKEIIVSIYNSYKKDTEKGDVFKRVAAKLLRILQILVPSQSFSQTFRRLIYVEWMEHRIQRHPYRKVKKFYRDHILHPANVCWIGERLLSEPVYPFYEHIRASLEAILPDQCKNDLKSDAEWRTFIKITWYITAIIHDFGYFVELNIKNLHSGESSPWLKDCITLDKIKEPWVLHPGDSIFWFKKQVEKIDKRLIKNPYYKISQIHPLIGTLDLLHFLDKNHEKLKSDKNFYLYIYQLAALGIFEHHANKNIDLYLNPFGYLLTLADEIHEWDRYINAGSPVNPDFLSPIKKVIFSRGEEHVYRINYVVSEDARKIKIWKHDKLPKEKAKKLSRLKAGSYPIKFLISS